MDLIPGLDAPALAAASVVIAIGATLQGTIGFGLGVFAVPLLLLFAPVLVPGPLLASSLVLSLLLTHLERRAVNWPDLGWALGGRTVGIVLAAGLLVTASTDTLAVASAFLVLTAVALTASGLRFAPAPRMLVAAGMLSGILGTVVSIGGPPMALVYQGESGPRLRGTLSAFFLIGVSLSVVGLHLAGRFGARETVLAAWLVPAMLLGFAVSRRLSRLLDRGYIRHAVLAVSALSSAMVLLRAL
jgi:hypothetical protein